MGDHELHLYDLDSEVIGAAVPLAVVTLAGVGATDDVPLCINLHGGGSDRETTTRMAPFLGRGFASGRFDPMVVVTPSTGPLSWYREPWEEFIAEELPAAIAERHGASMDPDQTVIMGGSMGGFGALKTALRRPDRFRAVAAMEPAIEPGFRRADVTPRALFYRFPDVDSALWGDPVDESRWAHDNPANIARDNAEAIRNSGMEVLLECGDQDGLNLHDGAEFLHRTLWDLDIRHEFHLIRWADHVGASFGVRIPAVLQFLQTALRGGASEPSDLELTDDEQAWVAWSDGGFVGDGPDIDSRSPSAVSALRRMNMAAQRQAAATDPTWGRSYGVMPS